MLFQKKSNSRKYIEKILRNKYGFPSQIIPINNEVGVLIGTFVKNRTFNAAQYGVWLIALDFSYNSEGMSFNGLYTQKSKVHYEFQRIFLSVNNAISILKTGSDSLIKDNYIANFLNKALIKYNNRG